MIDPERNELFVLLAELARRYPEWRLGQLVANAAGWADVELWDVEDRQLISAVRAHLSTTNPTAMNSGPGQAVEQATGT
jgi:hypothetical protein